MTTPNEVWMLVERDLPAIPEGQPLALALDRLQDPGNLGTIIRTADWFGVRHIVCSPDSVSCFNPKVVQSTMGSLFRTSVSYTDLHDYLHSCDKPVFGALLDGQSIWNPHTPLQLPAEGAVLVVGNESRGISPEVFEGVDEKATNSLLYSLSMGMYSFGSGFPAMGDLPVNDKLYLLQHKIIKEIAEKENCVIVGRCADYVLRDNPKRVSIFIYADMEYRKEQSIKKHGIDPAHAEHIINKTDKNRANYYSFYSGQKWGQAENFDLCIDSSKLDEDKIVDLIAEYINMR